MKVVFFITSLGMGGAENVLASLCDGLVKLDVKIKIICLKGPVIVRPMSTNIEIINLNINSINGFVKNISKVRKIINNFQPDVVHAHMFHAIIYARLLRLTCFVKRLICTAHSTKVGGTIQKHIYRITDFLSDVNTNVSEEATQNFIKQGIFNVKKTVTVTNGVNVEKFRFDVTKRQELRYKFGLSDNTNVFMAVGRFSYAKDYPNMLKAFSLYKRQDSCFKLFIVGDGELRGEIESLIQRYDLIEDIILLGVRSDVSELFNMSDFFILSSAWEGLPTVLIEAMATERVIVTTDCGGVKEIIGDSKFLVPIQDPLALSEKIAEAVMLPSSSRYEVGVENRRRIQEKFSLDVMVEKWLELYIEQR